MPIIPLKFLTYRDDERKTTDKLNINLKLLDWAINNARLDDLNIGAMAAWKLEAGTINMGKGIDMSDLLGDTILDGSGINPEKELWSPNLWANSDIRVYNSALLPRFCSGTVTASSDATFVGQMSIKIPPGGTYIYAPEAAYGASFANPQWLLEIATSMYISFYVKCTGGADASISVRAYDATAAEYVVLTDVAGNTGTTLTFARGDWSDGYIFVYYASGARTDVRPEITNNDGALYAYINAPQHCANVNNKYPQPYIMGKFSVGTINGRAVELMSDIALYVQDTEPTDMADKDLWVDTDDYSTYDMLEITSGATLGASGAKYIKVTGTTTIVLFAVSGNIGVIRKIVNVGSGLVTIDGSGAETIGGELTFLLYPYESIEIICDGTAWGVF